MHNSDSAPLCIFIRIQPLITCPECASPVSKLLWAPVPPGCRATGGLWSEAAVPQGTEAQSGVTCPALGTKLELEPDFAEEPPWSMGSRRGSGKTCFLLQGDSADTLFPGRS